MDSMKRKCLWFVLSAPLLLLPPAATSQIDVSSVTARLGVIRTLQDETYEAGHLWSLYPELQLGGLFFTKSLTWGVSWGYWTDGLNHEFDNVVDHATFSQKGHIFTLRLAFEPEKVAPHWPIPLKLFAGAAKHIIFSRHIGGTDFTGRHGPDSTYYPTTLYGGLSLAFPFSSKFQFEAEVAQFVPIGDDAFHGAQEDRRDFKLGIVVSI